LKQHFHFIVRNLIGSRNKYYKVYKHENETLVPIQFLSNILIVTIKHKQVHE